MLTDFGDCFGFPGLGLRFPLPLGRLLLLPPAALPPPVTDGAPAAALLLLLLALASAPAGAG